MKIVKICDRVITYSFYTLFFLVPLLLTPLNYELFEYNKMMAVYALTTIIVGGWLIKMVTTRQLIVKRTSLDIPIVLFLVSQFLSFSVSIDRHVSLFGYYSRFHGGLLSTLSYILLYYALVSNIDKEKVLRFLKVSLLSALVVSIYGILEHFGIDKDIWVQDVQNRVFSTLGQPNWLAAYLAILIPISMAFALTEKLETRKQKLATSIYYLLPAIYYLTLLYTKSRSGFLGFLVAGGVFWFLLLLKEKKAVLKPFSIFLFSFFILTFIAGAPFAQINKFTAQELFRKKAAPVVEAAGPALETGGTESGEIRRIVWKGALEIARHYPLFGSGVETFAYSYYQFRPKEHNLVSEWDFLYNKAHNEYLNYAATTGFVGLGSYLLLIGWFIVWILKSKNRQLNFVVLALFAGYTSILITNFFGFSVVPVAIYFYLIPAMSFVLSSTAPPNTKEHEYEHEVTRIQSIVIVFLLFSICYLLFTIAKHWYADTRFNRANLLARAGYYKEAYQPYHQAIDLNPGEPLYRDELAYTAAVLAVAAYEQKEATLSSQLVNEALYQSKIALTTSPANINFWKTRTKIFYALSSIDDPAFGGAGKYNEEALTSLLTAQKLAPTEAKIAYNLGLLYGRVGNSKMAIKTLEETVELKPNYGDARYALALFYNEAGKRQEAIAQLEYILTKISTDAAEVKEKLEEWQ